MFKWADIAHTFYTVKVQFIWLLTFFALETFDVLSDNIDIPIRCLESLYTQGMSIFPSYFWQTMIVSQ